MNKKNYPLSDLNVWLGQVDEIKVLLPEKPRLDQVAAASALSDSLNKSGKKAQILCPRPLTVEFGQVFGVDQISNRVEGRSFIINIDYSLKNIEKINWDDQEEERVSLVIEPKTQAPSISEKLVSFQKGNGEINNLIALGFSSRSQVDQAIVSLGSGQKPDSLNIVNVAIDQTEFFGQIKLIDNEASSFSEVIAGVIEGLSLSISPEAAQNLLLGLRAATNSFSVVGIGPGAFEAAAFCLRAGGRLAAQENQSLEDQNSDQAKFSRFDKPKIYRGSANS
ncbi:MAG: hypothetical protein PHU92_00640 [Candidatus Shapirobacteria bacterium]|nr:hypothetical protein [Candidatus Shapirobacteria bacterium]